MRPDPIHMACYDVSAKTSVGRHGTFQIDSTSNGELRKRRAVQGLVHDIRSKAIREELPDGQADAVDGDAVGCRRSWFLPEPFLHEQSVRRNAVPD